MATLKNAVLQDRWNHYCFKAAGGAALDVTEPPRGDAFLAQLAADGVTGVTLLRLKEERHTRDAVWLSSEVERVAQLGRYGFVAVASI